MLIDSSMRVYLNNNLFVCFNSVYGVELSYPVHDTAKATITAEHPLLYTPIAQERVYVQWPPALLFLRLCSRRVDKGRPSQ